MGISSDGDNVENEHCEGDQTTEEFVERIVEALTIPADSEDEVKNIREDFEILMPDGKKRKVSLHPADTLVDIARILKAKFGTACLFIGVKIDRVTKPPPIQYPIGMFNDEESPTGKQQIAITYVN